MILLKVPLCYYYVCWVQSFIIIGFNLVGKSVYPFLEEFFALVIISLFLILIFIVCEKKEEKNKEKNRKKNIKIEETI